MINYKLKIFLFLIFIYFTPVQSSQNILLNQLFNELKGRITLSDQSPYVKKDKYYYYTRIEENQEYPIYCRKHISTKSKEIILLDVNRIALNKPFTNLGCFSVSPDHRLIAYSIDHTGKERFTTKIFDTHKNTHLKDVIHNTIGEIVYDEDLYQFTGEYIKSIDLGKYEKAMYFLEIQTNDGTINKKLILQ